MSQEKQAGQTQVAWALLTQGVAQARLDAHRIRHLLSRALNLVEHSPSKEHFYEVAGDMITLAPRRMDALETSLDRTSYALSVLGEDHLRERLPIEDRAIVDDAVHKARPFAAPQISDAANRVAERYNVRTAGTAVNGWVTPRRILLWVPIDADGSFAQDIVKGIQEGERAIRQIRRPLFNRILETGVFGLEWLQYQTYFDGTDLVLVSDIHRKQKAPWPDQDQVAEITRPMVQGWKKPNVGRLLAASKGGDSGR